jgi:hypothetical protein
MQPGSHEFRSTDNAGQQKFGTKDGTVSSFTKASREVALDRKMRLRRGGNKAGSRCADVSARNRGG